MHEANSEAVQRMSAAVATDSDELPNISAIRRRHARVIVERVGSIAEFCDRLGITRQRAHALLGVNSTRNIGDELARRIEDVFSLPKNSLDHLNTDPSTLADALEFIERNETSQPDKIAEQVRAIRHLYKNLGLEKAVAKPQNTSLKKMQDENDEGSDVITEHSAIQPAPARRKRKSKPKRKRK